MLETTEDIAMAMQDVKIPEASDLVRVLQEKASGEKDLATVKVSTDEGLIRGAAAGFVGGIAQTYAGQPFDTLKVRMQTATTKMGLTRLAADTLRQEGFRGLYKGTTPALMFGLMENTVALGVNEQVKSYLSEGSDAELPVTSLAFCGAAGGLAHCCFSCPLEVVKCRMQVSGSQYAGPLDCAMKAVRAEGFASLYRGFTPFVLREVPFYLSFLTSYEVTCSAMQRFGVQAGEKPRTRDGLSTLEILFAGGFAGCIGWTLVLPPDTVKTQMQTASDTRLSSVQMISQINRTAGIRGFFPGWSAAMLRSFPANAALFAGFEWSRRWMNDVLG